MRIRFVKAYTHFEVGDVIDETQVGASMAKGFVNLGIAEALPEEKPAKVEKGAKE